MDGFFGSRNDDDANQRYAQPYRHGPSRVNPELTHPTIDIYSVITLEIK